MSGIPFHNTRMGHCFIEHTVPELVRQISRLSEQTTRLNDLLERLVDRLPEPTAAPPKPPDEDAGR